MLPSSRMGHASLLDRDTLTAAIAALYAQLDLQDAVVAGYHSLEEVCQNQRMQIDRLQTQLRLYVEIAPLLATYVQAHYLDLWTDCQNLIERLQGFQTELTRRLGQDHVVRELKKALLESDRKSKQAEDRRLRESFIAQQQVEEFTSCLAAAEHNLVAISKPQQPRHPITRNPSTKLIENLTRTE